MNREINDLLAEMKTEFQVPKEQEKPLENLAKSFSLSSSNFTNTQISSSPTMNNSSFSASPMDDLLSELKEEFTQGKSSTEVVQTSQTKVQNLIETDLEKIKNNADPVKYSTNLEVDSVNHNLLNSLKNDLRQEQQQLLEEHKKQEQLKLEEQRKQEQLKQERKRKVLRDQAQTWLKNLNPKSKEGMWFEEFAYGYESKLEAAMDYLEALKEVNF